MVAHAGGLYASDDAVNRYRPALSAKIAAAAQDNLGRLAAGAFMLTLETWLEDPPDEATIVAYPQEHSTNMLVIAGVAPPIGLEEATIPVCAQQNNKVLGTWRITPSGDVLADPWNGATEGEKLADGRTRPACNAFLVARRTAMTGLVRSPKEPVPAGRPYSVIDPPHPLQSPGTPEVIEFFWYGCPGCTEFEPAISAWAITKSSSLNFRRVPLTATPRMRKYARLFVTFEALGLAEKYHHALVNAIAVQGVALEDPETLRQWLGTQGINEPRLLLDDDSFASSVLAKKRDALLAEIDKLNATYRVRREKFVVNGRYKVPAAPGVTRVLEDLLSR